MLRKEDSNKVLKRVKVVLFATSLSLMNPIEANAGTVDAPVIEETNGFDWKDLFNICVAGGVANLLVNFKLLHDFNKYAEDEDIEEIVDLVKPRK